MARSIPPRRYDELLDAATRVFISQGYRGAQMSDIAREVGLSKGTLYVHVVSKDALFAEAIRYADVDSPVDLPGKLPVEAPAPGELVESTRKRLHVELDRLTSLFRELKNQRDLTKRVETFLREVYRALSRNRTAIKLLDRCAHEHPDLNAIWTEEQRFLVLDALIDLLATRSGSQLLRVTTSPDIAGRTAIETMTFWAVHRHWDRSPRPVDESEIEGDVVRLILTTLVRDESNPAAPIMTKPRRDSLGHDE